LPLIKTSQSEKLIALMDKIFVQFLAFYQERLDDPVKKEEILNNVNAEDDCILEALSYFRESHNVWGGWGKDFPYEDNSQINITEGILSKKNILEILTDYYRWNFINKENIVSNENEINIPDTKIDNKKVGRPDSGKDLYVAYNLLKKEKKIDYSQSLKAHENLIQDTVKALRQSDDMSGTNYKTICKYLSGKFKQDKKSIN
jgi:hypothetical protein